MSLVVGQRTVVLANHQSTADVPMLMAAWTPRMPVLPNIMWIMDKVFKYTNFGVVSVLHQDFFIQAGRESRDSSLEELRRHIREVYTPFGRHFMVLFPEGGFLHKRKAISQSFAKKNNLPDLEYVTLPRAGALKVIMEEAGPRRFQSVKEKPATSRISDESMEPHGRVTSPSDAADDREPLVDDATTIRYVLDVTIAYPERRPLDLCAVVCGTRPPCVTRLHYRIFPASQVPRDPDEMTHWLYDRFVEKNDLLEEFYRTGSFPGSQQLRLVRQDSLRFIIIHLFFIMSTFVQVRTLCWFWEALSTGEI